MSKTFKLSAIFLITVLMLLVFRIGSSFIDLPDNIFSWLFSFFFQVLIMGLTPYLLYTTFINKEPLAFFKETRISHKINPITYILAILVGLVVFYLNTIISTFSYLFLNSIGYKYVASVGTIFSSPEVLIFEIITSAMLPAIFEEITDRGLLLAIFEDVKDDRLKMLFVGIMFGFLHQNVVQLASTMFAGVILAYIAIKTSSILPAMIVHFMNNFLITMLNYSEQRSGAYNDLYNSIFNFTFSGVAFFIMIGLAGVMLYVMLIQIKKINAPFREAYEELPLSDKHLGNKQREKILNVIIKAAERSEEEDFDYIFNDKPKAEISSETNNVFNVVTVSETELKEKTEKPQNKIKFRDYALLYCAIVVTIITTIFTFIWGAIR